MRRNQKANAIYQGTDLQIRTILAIYARAQRRDKFIRALAAVALLALALALLVWALA